LSNDNIDLLYPDDPEETQGGEFSDFLPSDATEEDIQYVREAERLMGRPVSDIFVSFQRLQSIGQVGDLRGVRFGSGLEAFRWLLQRGLFLYSKLVQMNDGSWGVAIGTSQNQAQVDIGEESEDNDDLVF